MFAIQGNVWKAATDKLNNTLKHLHKKEASAGQTLELENSARGPFLHRKLGWDSHSSGLHTVCGRSRTSELSGCDTDHCLQSLKQLLSLCSL